MNCKTWRHRTYTRQIYIKEIWYCFQFIYWTLVRSLHYLWPLLGQGLPVSRLHDHTQTHHTR